ncbi:MAG: hypothetical protein JWQ40_3231 [Segetibacter sp.]|nr:hypothetical protein [Segetibacter sp.]
MNINFNFRGSQHTANVVKYLNNDIEVVVKDDYLGKEFGSSFHYYLNNDKLDFVPLNPAHSELYKLQSEIKNAIQQFSKY